MVHIVFLCGYIMNVNEVAESNLNIFFLIVITQQAQVPLYWNMG